MVDYRIDEDARLLKLVAQGDESAFEELVKKHEIVVFNTIYRFTGNQDDVADLAQEIFLKVWRNAGKFQGKSKFSTWLYRIVVNHCLDHCARNKRPFVSLDELAEKEIVPDVLGTGNDYIQQQTIELVRKAIALLPARQRMALTLAEYEGRSYKEIASMMKISVSSVESLIFRARKALRSTLKKWRSSAGFSTGPASK
jgi:RNA polymerase sigma-70 factor (ECF subfamily)